MNVLIDPTTHPAYRNHDREDVVVMLDDAVEEVSRLAELTALVMLGARDPRCQPEQLQAGLQAIHDRLNVLVEDLDTPIRGARVLLGVIDDCGGSVQ